MIVCSRHPVTPRRCSESASGRTLVRLDTGLRCTPDPGRVRSPISFGTVGTRSR